MGSAWLGPDWVPFQAVFFCRVLPKVLSLGSFWPGLCGVFSEFSRRLSSVGERLFPCGGPGL